MFCKRNVRVGVVLGIVCLVATGVTVRLSAQDAKTAEPGKADAAKADAAKADAAAGSPPPALAMYADAANYQNNSAFDVAAEEWARFLELFPNDPLTPKAQQYLGVCQLQLKQYAKAVESFQKVVAKFPKFEQIEETYLNLGWCYYSLATAGDATQFPLAAATFNKLAADFPQGKNVDQALFFEAESLYAMGKHKEAALAYGKLVTNHADSKLRADALYALGVTLEDMSEWVQANKAYDMFIEGFPRSDLIDRSADAAGRVHFAAGAGGAGGAAVCGRVERGGLQGGRSCGDATGILHGQVGQDWPKRRRSTPRWPTDFPNPSMFPKQLCRPADVTTGPNRIRKPPNGWARSWTRVGSRRRKPRIG